jgi:hypothetical protein
VASWSHGKREKCGSLAVKREHTRARDRSVPANGLELLAMTPPTTVPPRGPCLGTQSQEDLPEAIEIELFACRDLPVLPMGMDVALIQRLPNGKSAPPYACDASRRSSGALRAPTLNRWATVSRQRPQSEPPPPAPSSQSSLYRIMASPRTGEPCPGRPSARARLAPRTRYPTPQRCPSPCSRRGPRLARLPP